MTCSHRGALPARLWEPGKVAAGKVAEHDLSGFGIRPRPLGGIEVPAEFLRRQRLGHQAHKVGGDRFVAGRGMLGIEGAGGDEPAGLVVTQAPGLRIIHGIAIVGTETEVPREESGVSGGIG